MFLTRMALDVNREETRVLLADPGQTRQAVMSAFDYGNVLWRIDELAHRTWLVMLSYIRPDLWEVHQRYGYLGAFPSWETLDFDRELEDAHDGTSWMFDLCAAPVGTQTAPSEDWTSREFLNGWLTAQGETCGFRLVYTDDPKTEWRQAGEQWLLLVRWRGKLCITDEEQFLWAIARGIGGARELGAGLMTIAGRTNVWDI